MNIFYLHDDPVVAARWHNDKHVVKMILEYAQLMSTAHHVLGTSLDRDVLYRKTHMNHPSAVWVRESANNYVWLYKLFCAVCDEYTFRYGKVHKTDKKLRDALAMLPVKIPHVTFTPPPQAMPEDCRGDDAILAYRKYYICHKSHIAKWKDRPTPSWYENSIDTEH